MTKKVLILSSSLRPNSNSEQLAREAGRGAVEAGHDVEVLSLAGRDLRYCEGCMACHRLLYCPIQDDANDLIKKVQEADVVVFASPIYYYDICGQLKTFLDRTNPLYGQPYRFRDIYLITVSADDAPDMAKRAVSTLDGWICCFDKARYAGGFNAGGMSEANVAGTHPEWMQKAYELGKSI